MNARRTTRDFRNPRNPAEPKCVSGNAVQNKAVNQWDATSGTLGTLGTLVNEQFDIKRERDGRVSRA